MRVLLVDDDRDTLQTLRFPPAECGAVVRVAASAAEAVAALQWFAPDVLVCDHSMPDEDGFSLIAGLRASEAAAGKRGVPAVALTANVRFEDRAHALSAGFQKFVPKPVEPRELVTAVASLAEPGAEVFGLV